MKLNFALNIFILSAFPCAAIAEKSVPAEEPYSVSKMLERENTKRSADAENEFYGNPRESTLSLSVGGFSMFGIHGATSDGDGWGASVAVLTHINSDTPDANFLLGGELIGLQSKLTRDGRDTLVRSANIIFSVGMSYDFCSYFSAGILFGYSPLGATYRDRDRSGGSTETTGTLSSTFSVKPYAEFMINKNLSIYGAYRFFYISPSVISSATNWGDIEVGSQAVEFGIRYRF